MSTRRPDRGQPRRPDRTDTARTRYMLDANAFDYLLDHAIDPRSVRRLGELCITTVQHGELLSVPDPVRRKRLLGVLSGVDPTVRPAFSGARSHDVASDGDAASSDPSRFQGSSRKSTRWKDAAIGEVADLEGCTLVTDDGTFRRRALDAGLTAMSCAEAFAGLDSLPDR